jgi:hypothetical protein
MRIAVDPLFSKLIFCGRRKNEEPQRAYDKKVLPLCLVRFLLAGTISDRAPPLPGADTLLHQIESCISFALTNRICPE